MILGKEMIHTCRLQVSARRRGVRVGSAFGVKHQRRRRRWARQARKGEHCWRNAPLWLFCVISKFLRLMLMYIEMSFDLRIICTSYLSNFQFIVQKPIQSDVFCFSGVRLNASHVSKASCRIIKTALQQVPAFDLRAARSSSDFQTPLASDISPVSDCRHTQKQYAKQDPQSSKSGASRVFPQLS